MAVEGRKKADFWKASDWKTKLQMLGYYYKEPEIN
jgi:hypothetical protein